MLKITGAVTLLMVGFISASHAEDNKSQYSVQVASDAVSVAAVQSAAAPMNDCPPVKASAPVAAREAYPSAASEADEMRDRLEGTGRF